MSLSLSLTGGLALGPLTLTLTLTLSLLIYFFFLSLVLAAGLTLGPVDAENVAALAALHLLKSLDAAALTGDRLYLRSSLYFVP